MLNLNDPVFGVHLTSVLVWSRLGTTQNAQAAANGGMYRRRRAEGGQASDNKLRQLARSNQQLSGIAQVTRPAGSERESVGLAAGTVGAAAAAGHW